MRPLSLALALSAFPLLAGAATLPGPDAATGKTTADKALEEKKSAAKEAEAEFKQQEKTLKEQLQKAKEAEEKAREAEKEALKAKKEREEAEKQAKDTADKDEAKKKVDAAKEKEKVAEKKAQDEKKAKAQADKLAKEQEKALLAAKKKEEAARAALAKALPLTGGLSIGALDADPFPRPLRGSPGLYTCFVGANGCDEANGFVTFDYAAAFDVVPDPAVGGELLSGQWRFDPTGAPLALRLMVVATADAAWIYDVTGLTEGVWSTRDLGGDGLRALSFYDGVFVAVPLPATLWLGLAGVGALAALGRRRV